MAQNKKQHYVPRFYLKRFSADGLSLNLFNFKSQKAIYKGNLKNQCYRNYMYGKDLFLETQLSGMEGEFAKLFSLILDWSDIPRPYSDAHHTLVVFVITQYARTAHSADTADETADKVWKRILSHHPDVTQEMLNQVKIVQTNGPGHTIALMLSLYPLLMDVGMRHRLLIAPDGSEFITSDNPVVFYNQLYESGDFDGGNGLACKGLQVFLPMSPRVMLMMYDAASYRVLPKRQAWTQLAIASDVDQLNRLQVVSALQNLYFRTPKGGISGVVKSARHLRRTQKAHVSVSPERSTPQGKSELIGMSRVPVKTNLDVSFIALSKEAKQWRTGFKALRYRPAVVVRDEGWMKLFENFEKVAKEKKYSAPDFFKYLDTLK